LGRPRSKKKRRFLDTPLGGGSPQPRSARRKGAAASRRRGRVPSGALPSPAPALHEPVPPLLQKVTRTGSALSCPLWPPRPLLRPPPVRHTRPAPPLVSPPRPGHVEGRDAAFGRWDGPAVGARHQTRRGGGVSGGPRCRHSRRIRKRTARRWPPEIVAGDAQPPPGGELPVTPPTIIPTARSIPLVVTASFAAHDGTESHIFRNDRTRTIGKRRAPRGDSETRPHTHRRGGARDRVGVLPVHAPAANRCAQETEKKQQPASGGPCRHAAMERSSAERRPMGEAVGASQAVATGIRTTMTAAAAAVEAGQNGRIVRWRASPATGRRATPTTGARDLGRRKAWAGGRAQAEGRGYR